jgi:hypothetical protein
MALMLGEGAAKDKADFPPLSPGTSLLFHNLYCYNYLKKNIFIFQPTPGPPRRAFPIGISLQRSPADSQHSRNIFHSHILIFLCFSEKYSHFLMIREDKEEFPPRPSRSFRPCEYFPNC